jgi:hypothetical protein
MPRTPILSAALLAIAATASAADVKLDLPL